MTDKIKKLLDSIQTAFAGNVEPEVWCDEVLLTVEKQQLIDCCQVLKFDNTLAFNQLIDLCGVDYLHYGKAQWQVGSVTETGYSRAKYELDTSSAMPERFAVVYQLLSLHYNWRVRLKVFLPESDLEIPSVNNIWASADWFEREAYDLFGIFFQGHPDLRRILTDYGFIGHPFRKDFPLEGRVEMRYDAMQGRCVYEDVSITNRVVIPKVIRNSVTPEIDEDSDNA